MKFKCRKCGNCCTDFGELGTLPIFDDEKIIIKQLAEKIGISVEFIPENVMMDEITGTMFCGNWGLKGNPCPFLDENNLCKIYEERPLICKAFPIHKIPTKNEGLTPSCFMKCPNFDFKKFIESSYSFYDVFGKSSVNSRILINNKQRIFSEKIFGLISLGKIKLKKVENPYFPDVISIEQFFKIIGI